MKDVYLKLNYGNILPFIKDENLNTIQTEVNSAKDKVENKNGLGHEFLGWLDTVGNYDPELIEDLINTSKQIQEQSDILVVIGIGGSYLGAKAATEYMKSYFNSKAKTEVIFAGQNLSSTYLSELLEYLKTKEFSINVISKSGTTTEPAIAFRALKLLLEDKYGEKEANKRIYATTDETKGALRTLANEKEYKTFIVPDDIGGRYSVLTPVGLLPISVAGIDILKMLEGAKSAKENNREPDIHNNDALMYAAIRNLLYRNNFSVELLVNSEPKLNYFSEWWKQLFGESEGKEGKGLFVASASFTTDLHSLGQFIQDGKDIIFETIINIEKPEKDLEIKKDKANLDQLNYLNKKTVDYVNKQAIKGTTIAHLAGKTPNMMITIPEISAFSFGYLVYFFEYACAISGYLLGVNPFNQPGVESYKKNMFALLEKPGYEELTKEIKKKL